MAGVKDRSDDHPANGVGGEATGGESRADEDRRFDSRIPVDMWITQEYDQERSYSHSADLSPGGMAIDCGWPHPIGTRVTLQFILPGTEYVFSVQAEVVGASWVEGRPITNFHFMDLTGDEHILITKYVEKT